MRPKARSKPTGLASRSPQREMAGKKVVRSSNRRSISQPTAARIVIVATGVDAVGVAAADVGMAATRVMDEGRIAAQRLTGVQSEVQTEVQTEARNELLSEVG